MLTSSSALLIASGKISTALLELVYLTADTLKRLIIGHSRILFSPRRVGRVLRL